MKIVKLLAILLFFWSAPNIVLGAKVTDIVAQMKSVSRETVTFNDGSSIVDLVNYCKDWANEAGLTNVVISLNTLQGKPFEMIPTLNLKHTTLYDVLEQGVKNCYHFFTIKDGTILVCPNIPKYIDTREWTDRKGKKINAKWVGCADGNPDVPILQVVPSGKIIKIDTDKMSAKDRRYFRESRSKHQKVSYRKKNGRWMSPLEEWIEEANLVEQRYIDRAKNMVMEKSYKLNSRYQVFQILEIGTLCFMSRTDSHGKVIDYNGELFLNLGLKRGNVANDECYISKSPLYWLGTYTYITRKNEERTVNVYNTCSLEDAIYTVRRLQGLYDSGDERFEDNNLQGSGRRTKHNDSDIQILGFGSGFFITRNGYFITNFHVIDGATKVALKIGDNPIAAKVVKIDADTDLALLKVDGTYDAVEFSPIRIESLGQSIFTIGYPQPELQGLSPKVTKGVISGLEGFKGDVRRYQIDASIQPGNSGGPVADENGYVVGVAVSSLVKGTNGNIPQNVNYAIKKTYLKAFIDSIPECATDIVCPAGVTERSYISAVKKVEKSCALVVVYE